MKMTGKPKILIVENETAAAMQMVFLLTYVGRDVAAVHTAEKGMELAQENKFDLIVLAAELPGVSGFNIASELKQRHLIRRTPIIFVAEKPCRENCRRAFELGAADFIEQPFGKEFASRPLFHVKQTIAA